MALSSTSVYALVVCAAVLWGAGPVLVKRALNAGARPRQAVLVALAADTAVVWTAFALVRGVAIPGVLLDADPRVLALFALTGALGTGIGRLIGLVGLDRLGASVYSATLSVRPVFATALGVVALSESVTPMHAVGVCVLVAGLVVLERARTHGGGERGGWRRRDLAYPIVAAAAYAASRTLRRTGLHVGGVDVLAAAATNELAGLCVLAVVLGVRYGRDAFAPPRESAAPLVGSGICFAVGMIAVFGALAAPAGRVVVVDPLVATVPLFTVGFAAYLLETERITARVAVGTLGIVAGAALVVW
ncbi:hypothetical protein MBEHAL_1368 [Halarchaeum acidiphilum MH1-52-1]|uniref:EamA domain-containing protein n=2 Tax=Halarchaeum acidiphilum TaxID=489138 RepID=U3ACV8_9EURY|nr:DMT family transporter [Halarchaeum acidiphilum]GAD52608.1 hypothetical protein MBEHAL_1368 [Halarchaeum acidiphilum MH1-52-1]